MIVTIEYLGGPLDGDLTAWDFPDARRPPIPFGYIAAEDLALHAAAEAVGSPIDPEVLGSYHYLDTVTKPAGTIERFKWRENERKEDDGA